MATPIINPVGATYNTSQLVTISDRTAGSVIYYTTDGSTPTTSSTEYSQPLPVSSTTTIKAIATASGMYKSAIATATYTLSAQTSPLNTALPTTVSSPGYGSGFTTSGLTLNAGVAISGTILRLTDGGVSEARSAFFSAPVNILSFTNDFSFRLTNPNADGFTFTIQGQGATAVGSEGGCLGYCGITPSAAVKFDLYDNAGEGPNSTGLFTNGAFPTLPASDMTTSGVDLHSGDVMNVHMTYNGSTLTWTIIDASTGAQFQTSATVNIPSLIGTNTAYVGFTAGTGGSTATQDILSWTFVSGASQQLVTAQVLKQVATPSFSPSGGTFTTAELVTISDATPGAVIYYTSDGSTPTSSSTQYSGGIVVSKTTTLKAIATASGMTNSAMATATETIQAATTSLPQITTSGLPSGTVGVSYGAGLSATNGLPPYTWGVVGGQLPSGLALQTSTGQVGGTPSQAGTFSFSVQVKDSSNQTSSAGFSANIAPATSPVISSIAPNSGPIAGGTTVTISGSNFSSGAAVTFGGSAATSVTVSSPSQILAVTPSHIAGTVAVAVEENGQSSISNTNFTYNALTPTVTSISPNNGPTAGGTTVTINGSNFLAGALVLFGSVSASTVTVNSASQIQAVTPAGAAGAVNVSVQNPGNLSATLSHAFTYTSIAPTSTPANASGSINWNTLYQQIDGFGAAHVNVPDITAAQAQLIFSPTSGIGMTYLREVVPPDGSIDGLASMQLAIAQGAQVWATPWSPPASMKDNGSTINGGSLLPGSYQAYANYLQNYVNNLAAKGISLYALSVQNEPDITISYDSANWNDQQFHDFIKNNLGPTLSSGVKIIMPEPSGWDSLSAFDDTTMNDSSAASYVSILAAHEYDGAYDQQTTYGKHLWQTESSDLNSLDLSITSGLSFAMQIHNFLTVANVNAWHFWEITGTGGTQTDNECLICNGTPAKRLYTIGNFSKFIRPGYYRIDAPANPVSGVYVSAYKDPANGNFAIVAINTNGSDTPMSLGFTGFTASSLTPWVSSASLDLAQQPTIAGGSQFSTTLPAQSITTFVGTNGQ